MSTPPLDFYIKGQTYRITYRPKWWRRTEVTLRGRVIAVDDQTVIIHHAEGVEAIQHSHTVRGRLA
jgi:hypothetical protein